MVDFRVRGNALSIGHEKYIYELALVIRHYGNLPFFNSSVFMDTGIWVLITVFLVIVRFFANFRYGMSIIV